MRKSAFTLIEVMVVLSVLAIIAILAYNFFGSTMKEARLTQGATLIYKGQLAISDAMEKAKLDNPDVSTGPAMFMEKNGTFQSSILMNYLKAVPPHPAGVEVASCVDVNGGGWRGSLTQGWSVPGFGTTAHDDMVTAGCVPRDIALKYNELFAPNIGAAIVNNNAGNNFQPPAVASNYCYEHSGTGTALYYCIMYVEIR